MLKSHPIPSRPRTQLLIDALACHTHHLADLLLGDCESAAAGVELALLGEAKQRARQSTGKILQDHLLHLLTGPTQSRAEQFDEFHGQCRLTLHERKEVAAIDDVE